MTPPVAFSPYDYRIHEDPYPVHARLRDEAPLYRNSELDFLALSRHQDVVAAFRDPSQFSSANGVPLDPSAWARTRTRPCRSWLWTRHHTRLRALVSKGPPGRRRGGGVIRIEVDLDLCQGHAMCEMEAPDVFSVPRKSKVTAAEPALPESQRAAVEAAVRFCPTQAPRLLED